MADKKISALTSASLPLAGTEVLPIVQSGATVKVTTDDLTVKNIRSNATSGLLQIVGPAAASTRVVTVPNANVSMDYLTRAGNVLQVVTANYSTATSTTSTNWTSTGLTASITPISASNKILVLVSLPVNTESLGTYNAKYTLFRGTVAGTNLGDATSGFGNFVAYQNGAPYIAMFITASFCINYLDSPATTSAQTYTVAMKSEGNSNPAGVCIGSAVATITLMEIVA